MQDCGSYLTVGVRLVDLATFTLNLLPRIHAAIDLISGDSIANDIIDILDVSANLPYSFGAGTILEYAANATKKEEWAASWVAQDDYYLDRMEWMPCLIAGNIQFDLRSLSQAISVGLTIYYTKAQRIRPPANTDYLRFVQRLGGRFCPEYPASLYMPYAGSGIYSSDIIIAANYQDYGSTRGDEIQLSPYGMALCQQALSKYGSENYPNNPLVRGIAPDYIYYNAADMPIMCWYRLKHDPQLYISPMPAAADMPDYVKVHSSAVGSIAVTTWIIRGSGIRYSDPQWMQPKIYAGFLETTACVGKGSVTTPGVAISMASSLMRVKWR